MIKFVIEVQDNNEIEISINKEHVPKITEREIMKNLLSILLIMIDGERLKSASELANDLFPNFNPQWLSAELMSEQNEH